MRRACVSIFLVALMLFSTVAPVFAGPQPDTTFRAVYLGIKGYNTVDAAYNIHVRHENWGGPADWTFNFAIGDEIVEYTIDRSNNFYLHKKLAEGYVYEVGVRDGIVVALDETVPDAKGTVVSKTESGLNIETPEGDMVFVPINADTQYYKITNQAGGSTVEAVSLYDVVGKTVKVYGNLVYQAFVASPYTPPVKGDPNRTENTIKNLLATALEPCGTCLYVWGGSWTWAGAAVNHMINYDYENPSVPPNPDLPILPPWEAYTSHQSRTTGLYQKWIDFFQEQTETYRWDTLSIDPITSYRGRRINAANPANPYSTTSYGDWKADILDVYNYAGTDCSGYMGWVLYNAINTESGREGFTHFASQIANDLAHRAYGMKSPPSETKNLYSTSFDNTSFKPGDIFSMGGHVWMVVGVCQDGSILIIHSTPGQTREPGEGSGGGVQLSGIRASSGPGSEPDCQAYQLAVRYMETYYPEWSKRYVPIEQAFSDYVSGSSGNQGLFRWYGDERGMLDPDGFRNMTADQILAELFGDQPLFANLPSQESPRDNKMPSLVLGAAAFLVMAVVFRMVQSRRSIHVTADKKRS
ncbi:MAG: hypothetical protein ACOX34_09415 [Bacillota bacterium]|jgi:hypothetical protein